MNFEQSVNKASIFIRALSSPDELDACVAIQMSVWQYRDLDAIPRRVFIVSRAIGGQVLGAFDGDHLVGFAMALPGIRSGRPYLHSHMLAVLPAYRNLGIGAQLKWAQRDEALSRGIELMEWTFDPFAIKNANLNIEKLGAVVRRYTPDFYGVSSSPLHGSMPTDRLHAEWWLRSKRVERCRAMISLPRYSENVTIMVTDITKNDDGEPRADRVTIQKQLRDEFSRAFSSNLAVLRFQTHTNGDGSYVLGHWDESWEQ